MYWKENAEEKRKIKFRPRYPQSLWRIEISFRNPTGVEDRKCCEKIEKKQLVRIMPCKTPL